MRYLKLLIIICAVVANLANAVDSCCVSSDNDNAPASQHEASSSCHDIVDSDDDSNANTAHQCDCESCPPSVHLSSASVLSLVPTQTAHFFTFDHLKSPEPGVIYTPPKPLS